MTLYKRRIGNFGEDIACDYLQKNGYEIIARNKRYSKISEIDIVAKIKNTIVFVEVKTRRNNDFGTPFEAITKTKYNHMKQGALTFLSESENKYENFRLDVIGITLQPKVEINHMKNITF